MILHWRTALKHRSLPRSVTVPGSHFELAAGIAGLIKRADLPRGGDVVDLDEGGDDLILHSDGGSSIVVLQFPGLVL